MNKPSFLFILNPNSGTSIGRNTGEVKKTIDSFAKKFGAEVTMLFTEERAHATTLVRENLDLQPWKAIVAVGGDGTVNEIAQPLVNTEQPIGIIPLGSGNGLARHLGIPLTLEASLTRLFEGKITTIDSAQINDIPFFCTAGMGFDAYVGHLFSQQSQRGLATYVNVSFQSYWNYKPQRFKLNGVETDAFSLSFANAGQFGNNAWVAPQASLQDGLLDVCTIKPFPKWYGTSLAYQLFTKQMKASRYIDYQHMTEAVVETQVPPMIHYDGEPFQLDTTRIEVKIKPQSLRVIV
ncbi:diacylglycerol/lipid kinase family protein [Dyadobacter psychrophilus]|uniref:Diacylglycerol kinase family enzyme n=1 Tax=Dyadobacter psychrophilus TaxID=651661 RepID=A0A1T5H956_9BACT|nr:diacylglycerol kinase family protein [Dyadobacter psychrophilus]SKC17100.1 Diacylglycerol kinase family enzyme [Dyadobacter psychrophilus]